MGRLNGCFQAKLRDARLGQFQKGKIGRKNLGVKQEIVPRDNRLTGLPRDHRAQFSRSLRF
jgi:hypothetical protein